MKCYLCGKTIESDQFEMWGTYYHLDCAVEKAREIVARNKEIERWENYLEWEVNKGMEFRVKAKVEGEAIFYVFADTLEEAERIANTYDPSCDEIEDIQIYRIMEISG